MRMRAPVAGAFLLLLVGSAYVGLSTITITVVNDKVLHVLDFFLLTLCFYWVLDTSRRRALNITLVVCTAILGVGSEFVQGLIPNGRVFDAYDILANIVGSLTAVGLCSWYHKRMLERKRHAKHYQVVPGDDSLVDLELGERPDRPDADQQIGITPSASPQPPPSLHPSSVQADGWEDNGDDWDDGDPSPAQAEVKATSTPATDVNGSGAKGANPNTS